jgi:hypothetical protein
MTNKHKQDKHNEHHPHKVEQIKRQIHEVANEWKDLPERTMLRKPNGCGGWVSYKWNRNTWKPW